MKVLVLAEHDNNVLHPANFNIISAALQLTAKIDVLLAGFTCDKVAEQLSCILGVEKVLLADDICYQHQLAENLSELIADIAKDYSYILVAATSFGKDLMPRVAALLDVAQISDVNKIIDSQTFEHPIYAGNAIELLKSNSSPKLLTIRASAFIAHKEQQEACIISKINKIYHAKNTEFMQAHASKSERPDLSTAKIVVAGGRGLQSAEKFKLIEELADMLHAAVGASRAAVDAGFISNDYQVGQTGKIVAPDLYIAVGISGAIQHIAGMKDSRVIIAINKDADAPIVEIANYSLIGDLFEILPQIIQKLRG